MQQLGDVLLFYQVGEYSTIMDNGPARAAGTALKVGLLIELNSEHESQTSDVSLFVIYLPIEAALQKGQNPETRSIR